MKHRYILTREWNQYHRGTVNFIMLNPSTATDTLDDPTIRRCVGFAKRWGFSRLVVTNLFAYRASDPAELIALTATDPSLAIGKDNTRRLEEEADGAEAIVCAWGDNGGLLGRNLWLMGILLDQGHQLYCIRRTKKGTPAHPVRELYTTAPEVFMYQTVAT